MTLDFTSENANLRDLLMREQLTRMCFSYCIDGIEQSINNPDAIREYIRRARSYQPMLSAKAS